jgi:capsular polysaccharide biosynthesis protein
MDTPVEDRSALWVAKPRVPSADDALAMAVFQPKPLSLPPRVLLKFAALLVVIVALGGAVGYGVANRGEKKYAARSEIYYQIDGSQPTGFLREDRQLSTQLVVLRSHTVLLPVAQTSGMTVDELAKHVHVAIVESSEIIRVEVDDPSRSRALTLVRAITNEYLQHATDQAPAAKRKYVETQIATIGGKTRDLTRRATEIELANRNHGLDAEQALIASQLQSLLEQRNTLEARVDDIRLEELNQPRVERLATPYLVKNPVSPKPLRAAAAGALGGLLVAAAVLWFLARRYMSRDTRGRKAGTRTHDESLKATNSWKQRSPATGSAWTD